MIAPRFGQLYVASPEAGERLNQYYRDSGSTFDRVDAKLLKEMTADETIPDHYPLNPMKAPVIMAPLPDGRSLIATNKGQPDKDEFLRIQEEFHDARMAISGTNSSAVGAHDVAEELLLRRMDEEADIKYIGYDWLA